MDDEEIILTGGRSTESVVRIGDFVHRSMGPKATFVHELLQHVEQQQFPYAPRFTGIDAQGREILSYIEGEVLHGHLFSEAQLREAMLLLREFHDAASTSRLCGENETICHHDFAPWNLIMHRGKPSGIIDFDEAAPGSRIEDVAYFLWTFLDLGSLESSIATISQMADLVDTYRLNQPQQLVPAILSQQQRILTKREGIVHNSPNEAEVAFSREAILRIKQEMMWVETHREIITLEVQ